MQELRWPRSEVNAARQPIRNFTPPSIGVVFFCVSLVTRHSPLVSVHIAGSHNHFLRWAHSSHLALDPAGDHGEQRAQQCHHAANPDPHHQRVDENLENAFAGIRIDARQHHVNPAPPCRETPIPRRSGSSSSMSPPVIDPVHRPAVPAVRMNDSPMEGNRVWWGVDSKAAYFVNVERGEKVVHVDAVDAGSGEARELFSEKSDTYVELGSDVYEATSIRPLPKSNELIWYSERSGWAHLYFTAWRQGN